MATSETLQKNVLTIKRRHIMKIKLLLLSTFIGLNVLSAAVNIIPQPQELVEKQGSYKLKKNQQISFTGCAKEAKLLGQAIYGSTKIKSKLIKNGSAGIVLKVDPKLKMAKEGYTLEVTPNKVLAKAKTRTGIFYATQTILQLLPPDIYRNKPTKRNWAISCVKIKDEPAYPWRGLMLDVSRYFMDAEYVKQYIDIMAMHKLNVLHWHLIDDAGWRIEIKKYPKLTSVGAWRGNGKDRQNGGFYTQKEMRDIVKYAKERHIEIVPEIEIPAHTLAALAAYPYLGCRQIAHKVPERHFISRDLYCAGRDTTYEFLNDVMKEVFEIFPGKYVHVGGDEANYQEWKKCKFCQDKIKKEGLKNEHELQGYMTRFFEKLCQKNGREIIGWDEILGCNVSSSAGLMVWHNLRHAVEGAKKGHPIVAAYTRHTYFDTPESRLPGELVGAGWIPPVSLQNSYVWNPRPAGLTDEEAKNILGGHGCLWTDQFLHKPFLRDKPGEGDAASEAYVDKLTLPRAAGLAESTWTYQDKKDFDQFEERMKVQYLRYEANGWKYRLPIPKLTYKSSPEGTKVSAVSPIKGGKVYYTVNGEKPTVKSQRYKKSVTVKEEGDFQAVVISPSGKTISLVATKSQGPTNSKKFGKKIGEWKSGQIAAKKAGAKTFDATGKINKNGKYRIIFSYTGGTMRLDTDWIEILKNDQVIKRINRHGFTARNRPNQYEIKIDDYETGASFKVRAGIYGDEGNDSNGVVFIKQL